MKIKYYLSCYNRNTEKQIDRVRIKFNEAEIKKCLDISGDTDLIGDFSIDSSKASRIRKMGMQLDLRKGLYYIESEASLQDVMYTIENSNLTYVK